MEFSIKRSKGKAVLSLVLKAEYPSLSWAWIEKNTAFVSPCLVKRSANQSICTRYFLDQSHRSEFDTSAVKLGSKLLPFPPGPLKRSRLGVKSWPSFIHRLVQFICRCGLCLHPFQDRRKSWCKLLYDLCHDDLCFDQGTGASPLRGKAGRAGPVQPREETIERELSQCL